ncbi:serine/threonine protein kinase [Pseudovibrio sp. Ad13]|uniref:bifunctional aminoglycoside phosphotransferase/ATP-binding protein n=1 Tax=Pseudovibrio sp. Ad13 TaxID=989396 RepID=UPI0007B22622|nr:bifunctional aminoglycoside phosphotransferase/ATP-binding protein [Pseudovibrio sp. Ad13]KZK85034.1 serine/threonine protein kinase [Pseudovibrio sp. Ad13]
MTAASFDVDTLTQSDIISFFTSPEAHRGQEVKRIDTHANIAFLVGNDAYKMKRDVKFPFLDYSTLEKRKTACEAEIKLNSQYAPQIYRSTLPITLERDGSLELAGHGAVVEWVVHMNRFNEHLGLDRVAEEKGISRELAVDLAKLMVDAHSRTTRREAQPWIDDLLNYTDQNLEAFREFPQFFPSDQVLALDEAARKEHQHIEGMIRDRGELGLVRLNHGDAHLANIVMHDGKPLLFDAVEFDDAIATGDVLYDLAFLLLDLCERKEPEAANVVLNTYLQLARQPKHLEDLRVLRFYLMMRAAIRAKIGAAASLHQEGETRRKTEYQAQEYFKVCRRALEPTPPVLCVIGGLSGTGKTTLAQRLAPLLGRMPGAVHLRTDVLRKEMLDLGEVETASKETYTPEFSAKVYAELLDRAEVVLAAGHSVIIDGVYSKSAERDSVEQLAVKTGAEFQGIWLEADVETLINRVDARHGDASDADSEVVRMQQSYDLGEIHWVRLDSAKSKEAVLEQARRVTGLSQLQ